MYGQIYKLNDGKYTVIFGNTEYGPFDTVEEAGRKLDELRLEVNNYEQGTEM